MTSAIDPTSTTDPPRPIAPSAACNPKTALRHDMLKIAAKAARFRGFPERVQPVW